MSFLTDDSIVIKMTDVGSTETSESWLKQSEKL